VSRLLPVATALLALARPAGAAPTVTAALDRPTVPLGETLVLTISVSGADQVATPSLAGVSGFDVVSSGESRSFSMGSGGVTNETVFEFVLRPTAAGEKTIPPIAVQCDGQALRTRPLGVKVTPATGAGSTPPTLPMPSAPSTGEGASDEDVFIRATVDKKRAYVGEGLLLTFALYYAARLGAVDYQPAGTEGFRTQALPPPNTRQETVNGRPYIVREELKLLFPTAPGTHTITPARLQYTTGYWDPVPRTLTTEPIPIVVSRLPEAGQPAEFSGVVGNLGVEASVDRDTIRMGEAATLTVAVRGWGNLDAMAPPKLALPEGLRQYQSSEHREVAPEAVGKGYRLAGEALFDFVIIPSTVGELTVPPVEVAFFDPETDRYRVTRSRPTVLRVQPGLGEAAVPVSADTSALRPLPDRLTGARPGRLVPGWVVAGHVLAAAWLLGTLVAYRGRAARLADPRLARAHGAARRASRAIDRAAARPPREAAAEIASALAGYVADRLDVPPATVSAATVAALLTDAGASTEAAAQLASLLHTCDALRFGPVGEAGSRQLAEQALASLRALKLSGGRR